MKRVKINNKGITLVEIILTLALLSVAIGIVYSIHFAGSKSFEVSKDIGFAQQDARIISEYLNRELKYSSKISKDDYQDGRYFSIGLDNINGTKTLVKTKYENSLASDEVKLLNKDWENIEIELEQGDRTIRGSITIKLNNNTDYKLPITIPLENIKDISGMPFILSDTNKLYYALPEDALIVPVSEMEKMFRETGKMRVLVMGKMMIVVKTIQMAPNIRNGRKERNMIKAL